MPKTKPTATLPILFGVGEPMKQKKGFAVMSKAQRKRIATLGGLAVSQNTKFMSKIGRKGGQNSHIGDKSVAPVQTKAKK